MEPSREWRRRRCLLLADGSAVCGAARGPASLALALERSGGAFSLAGPSFSLAGPSLSRHLSATAPSAARALVAAAVGLRNRFAWLSGARPFLHARLLGGDALRFQRRMRSARARWPEGGEFRTAALVGAAGGGFCLELQSLEGLAKVHMHRSGLLVDVFLVVEARAATGDGGGEDGEGEGRRSESEFAYYTTLHQTFPVELVPERFALPVAILLRAKTALDNGEESFAFEIDRDRHSVMTALPEPAAASTRPEFAVVAPQALAATSDSLNGIPLPEILRVGTMPSKWLYRRVMVEVLEDDTVFFLPHDGSSALVVQLLSWLLFEFMVAD